VTRSIDPTPCWPALRRAFAASFSSSFHFAIASVGADGWPHVTPIGSLMLGDAPRAVYFEEFPVALPDNTRRDPRVCILGVNSSPLFWLRSLARGRFATPPAFRLRARVLGEPREVTPEELRRWERRVRLLRRLRGYGLLWGRMRRVRDLEIEAVLPVELGQMTRGHWAT